jgi:hypothetical protein
MKKRFLLGIMVVIAFAFVTVSCEEDPTFDETMLYGKWRSGTLFYKYYSGGDGTTWDTSDDVSEDEAQAFSWTLESDNLTHIYIMESGGSGVPKIYTVTELTESSLKYKDDFGKSYSFTKVSN